MSKTSGAEQTSEIKKSQKIDDKFNKVKNLSWLDASSWLFTSAAKGFELLTIGLELGAYGLQVQRSSSSATLR